MKPTVLLMAGAAVVALAACDDGVPGFGGSRMKAVSRLHCIERAGELRRVSVAADGKSCVYTNNDGGEVVLQLVAVHGDADAALKPIEASLASLVPPLDAPPAVADSDALVAKDADKAAKDAAATTAAAAADAGVDASASVDDTSDADHVDADTGEDVEHEEVKVDVPGLHVRTKGEKADVNVFGMQIDVDDEGSQDSVRVRREPRSGQGRSLSVDANDSGAVIRMGNSNRSNIKATVIYGMETPGPQGHRVVGYVARGPRTGPLVVATVRSKSNRDDHVGINEGIFADASRLARRAARG